MTTVNVSSATGSTVQATYLGASVAYPWTAPYGLVDSNSLFYGQVLTENTSWKWVTQFAHLTVDHTAGEAQTPPYGNDVNDYCTAEEGYEGEDTATIEVQYSDGTTAQFTATVTIAAATPTGVPVIGSITKDSSSASIPFTYAEDDATGFEHSIDGGTTWAPVTSPISRTGLDPETLYSGQVRATNDQGAGTAASYSFTTDAATGSAPTLISLVPDQSFTEGVSVNLDLAAYFSGDSISYGITGLPLGTGLSISSSTGVLSGTPTSSDVNDSPLALTVTATNVEGAVDDTFTATVAPENQVPQGTITFGTASKTTSSISQPFTYDASDQTGFEYRVDGGAWQALGSSPVSLSSLTSNTAYLIEVRAVNGTGAGTIASTTVTTDEEFAQVPQGTLTIGPVDVFGTLVRVEFSYDAADATAFEYNLDGGSWVAIAESPIWLSDLAAETQFTINVRSVNNIGAGTADSETFTTGAEPVAGGPTVVVDGGVTDNSAVPTKSTGRTLGAIRISGGYPVIHHAVKLVAADFVDGEAKVFRLPMGTELLGAWGIVTSAFDMVDGSELRFIINGQVALLGLDLTAQGWAQATQYPNGVVTVTRRDRTVVLSSPTLADPTVGEAVVYLSYILKE